MTTSSPEFAGGTEEKTNPKDFLRKAEVHLLGMNIEENRFARKIHLLFKAGSRVDAWYEELPEETKNGTWDGFSAAFLKEFPAPAVAKPTSSEQRKELLALRLQFKELVSRDEGTKEWSHQRFARQLLDLAKAAGIALSASDIISVHENLPKIIRRKVLADAKDWEEFTAKIAEVRVQEIKDDKEDKERLLRVEETRRLPPVPETPSKALSRAFASTTLGAPPMPLFSNRDTSTRRSPVSKLNDAQKTTLRANVGSYVQKPNTTEGIAAYMDEVRQFHQTHGTSPDFNETMTYPIAPGTLPPGSGECYKCGKAWHGKGVVCNSTSTISRMEGHWRAFIQRELGRNGGVRVHVVGSTDVEGFFTGFNPGNGEGSAE
ncbi:hypothetical protein VKT23_012658 [Stygiomarasmius scandens]|uniref:Retrotransposon gag domain-containing protein n=1 Tax=Marasmiellus scandens TaxID=2682957 RepID=A0ABR1J8E2_9AGAR